MTEKMTLSKYLSAKEICELCNISKQTLYKLTNAKQFPSAVKFGRCLRWNAESVQNWLIQQEQGA